MGLFSAASGQKVASATVRFHSRSKVTVTVDHGRGLSYERRRPVETEAPVVIEYSTAGESLSVPSVACKQKSGAASTRRSTRRRF